MTSPSLAQLRQLLREGPWTGELPLQIETLQTKETQGGKPYREIKFRDATDSLILRAWHDTTPFAQTVEDSAEAIRAGAAVAVRGEFYDNGSYGPDAKRWHLRLLTDEEAADFWAGSAEVRARLAAEQQALANFIATIQDPRLRALAERFLAQHGPKFYRAAAARSFHHARRGGLLSHTVAMLRSGDALCAAYPELNRDLLLAGILFHDAGKIWETCPPEKGFDLSYQLPGEMLGHITIGIELVNRLWADLSEERNAWRGFHPESDQVRLHLLHLIASHHGELQFGSPVEPKTPEALALHFLDNLDAKLEMVRSTYAQQAQIAPGIYDRTRSLPQRLVAPLAKWTPSEKSAPNSSVEAASAPPAA